MTNLDYASCDPGMAKTVLVDYNSDYLNLLEKENLDTVGLPYGFRVACPSLQTCVFKPRKPTFVINYENFADERNFVFDTPNKTDDFGSVVFTDVSAGNQKGIK